jgi:predicted transcriptional regulator
MDNKTYSVHINEAFIRRVDQHAEEMRRSRNSLICEAIEILLEQYDAAKLQTVKANNKKKAGTR